MGKPEGYVEDYLRDEAKRRGALCLKFTSPGTTGVPDRVLIGHGKTVFVEAKAPGQKPRPRQEVVFDAMRKRGAEVYVVDTRQGVRDLLDALYGKEP